MARGSSKKASKSTKTPTFNSSGPGPASTTDAVPLPFKPVPATLLPFAKCLPKDHVIVVHTERTPPAHRKQTFIVPVVMNLIITLGLCWRLYHAVPVYLEQMITILGYETSWTVTPKNLGWGDLMTILGNRTVLLSLDYALFGLLGRWPWEFVCGDKYGRYVGCAAWKWEVGFNRPTEVVIRRGRKWDAPIFETQEERQTQSKPAKTWTKEEELTVHNKCSTALSKVQTSKNALSLLDRDWDLDYKSMVDATHLLDQAKLSFDDVDRLALVPWHGRWYFWQPYKNQSNDGAQSPQEKDEKLEEFKKCLLQFDCEDIFYRWIEIIQYETAQPSGFTAAKKKEAEQELRKMIRNRKRDDDEFFKAIGGIENVPGLAADG